MNLFEEPKAILFDQRVTQKTRNQLVNFIQENYYPPLPLLIGNRPAFGYPQVMFFWNWDFTNSDPKIVEKSEKMRTKIFSFLGAEAEMLDFLDISALGIRNKQPNLFIELGIVNEFNRMDPTVIIFDKKNDKKFVLGEHLTLENLKRFFEDWKAGNLLEQTRSENALTKFVPGKLHELQGGNFRREIMHNDSGNSGQISCTFLAVTASWCSHCKALVPELKKLAEKLREKPVGDLTLT